ncbi:MAG: ABC transporter permease, partial [Chloroflexota bacterium]|nr:ABC transporter permease [Chloroflexota bacterium]
MNLLESLKVSLGALAAHKMRSLLTMLGIVIGVAAVISLMSIGRGVEASITERIQGMGSNLLFVRPGATTTGGVRAQQGSSATLTVQDAKALASSTSLPSIVQVAPEMAAFQQIVAGRQNVRSRIMGVGPEYAALRNFLVAEGEFITQPNMDAKSLVAVLGSNVAFNLFGPDNSPLGQFIRIRQRNFRVIGVLASKGGTSMGLEDDMVIVPLTTMQTRIYSASSTQGNSVGTIYLQVAEGADIAAAKEEAAQVLRERHRITGEDDFTITSQEDIIGTLTQVTQTLTLFLGAIAGISLLVGGIGIMNIM